MDGYRCRNICVVVRICYLEMKLGMESYGHMLRMTENQILDEKAPLLTSNNIVDLLCIYLADGINLILSYNSESVLI